MFSKQSVIASTFSCTVALFAASPVLSDGKTILILDGSGSMWGQIEGEAKITIARRVIGKLLTKLPAEEELGLYAYGHRQKGSCTDIQSLVPVGRGTGDAIRAAIDGIQPKGKTPISDAIAAAAEELKYQEERATVILVSDGRESCESDPCLVARSLEQAGANFTAHVIGFDVADPEEIRQLSCIAEETGGEFLSAANADQLAEKLEDVVPVVATPQPAPVPKPVPKPQPAPTGLRLVAVESGTNTPISGDFLWTIINLADESINSVSGASGLELSTITPGRYEVIAEQGEQFGSNTIEIAGGGMSELVVEVVVEAPRGLTVSPERAPAGSVVEATWNFDGNGGDLLFIMEPGTKDNTYPLQDRNRHKVSDGSLAKLVLPAKPGTYELRYFSKEAGGVLHRKSITVDPPNVSITGPYDAVAGKTVTVNWTGPAAPGDLLFIANRSWGPNQYPSGRSASVKVTPGTSTARLKVPGNPGGYEYRYYSWANGTLLYRDPVQVTLESAQVIAPPNAVAGTEIEVTFSGPRNADDRLFFSKASEAANRYVLDRAAIDRVKHGAPAKMVVPVHPGQHEIRYFSVGNGGLLAKASVLVSEPQVAWQADRSVSRGAQFEVRVKGPNAPGDFVFVAKSNQAPRQYPLSSKQQFRVGPGGGGFLDDDGNYVFKMTAPASTGQHELRYFSKENGEMLAKRVILVR